MRRSIRTESPPRTRPGRPSPGSGSRERCTPPWCGGSCACCPAWYARVRSGPRLGGSCCPPECRGGPRDAQQQVAELGRGGCALLSRQCLHDASSSVPLSTGLTESGQQDALAAMAPLQFWQLRSATDVEPRRLVSLVAIMPLRNAAGPAAEVACGNPSASARRSKQPMRPPSVRVGRMFDDAAPSAHSCQSRSEAATSEGLAINNSAHYEHSELRVVDLIARPSNDQ